MNSTTLYPTTNALQIPAPIISARQFDHYFGQGQLRKQVLLGINLEINAGEIVLMTGPSGSGKTTLLTLMGGLRSPQAGSLKVLGQELRGVTKNQLVEVRRNIGYIFQAHNLLKCLTARQNVQMSLELHPEVSSQEAVAMSTAMLATAGLTG